MQNESWATASFSAIKVACSRGFGNNRKRKGMESSAGFLQKERSGFVHFSACKKTIPFAAAAVPSLHMAAVRTAFFFLYPERKVLCNLPQLSCGPLPPPPGLKKQLVGFPAVKRSSCICQTKPTFFRWTSSRLRAKWSTRRDPHAKRLNMRRGSAAVFSHWENLLYISACNPVSQFCAMGSANG